MAETALRDPLNLIRLIPAKGTRGYLYYISFFRDHYTYLIVHNMLHSSCLRPSAKHFSLLY